MIPDDVDPAIPDAVDPMIIGDGVSCVRQRTSGVYPRGLLGGLGSRKPSMSQVALKLHPSTL